MKDLSKLKGARILSQEEQKSILGGSAAGARCCNPTYSCCYPVFGDPPQSSVIASCGLTTPSQSCDFWYSSNGCCI